MNSWIANVVSAVSLRRRAVGHEALLVVYAALAIIGHGRVGGTAAGAVDIDSVMGMLVLRRLKRPWIIVSRHLVLRGPAVRWNRASIISYRQMSGSDRLHLAHVAQLPLHLADAGALGFRAAHGDAR